MNVRVQDERRPHDVVILDLTDLRHTDIEVRRCLGFELVRACTDVGFFYIVNHGIPANLIDCMFRLTYDFFQLPSDEKESVAMARNEFFSGYLPMRASGDAAIKGTLMEAFHSWKEPIAGQKQFFAGKDMHDANVWPQQLPDMQIKIRQYINAVTDLTRELLKIAALGIGVPDQTFLQHFESPLSLLRLIHYPPQTPSDEAEGRYGIRPHTDNCALTLLLQDNTGGLQILGKNREWIDVAPIDGTYVVNLGETMKIWTNGLFKATPHRVINRSGKRRQSIAFFMNADNDAQIAPVLKESGTGELEPIFHSTVDANETTMTAGETLHRLYSKIYPRSGSNHLA